MLRANYIINNTRFLIKPHHSFQNASYLFTGALGLSHLSFYPIILLKNNN